MFERKEKGIRLFGEDLVITERSAADVQALEKFIGSHQDPDEAVQVKIVLTIIQDGLKANLENLKPWQIIRHSKLKKMFSDIYLIGHLSPAQLQEIVKEIRILEGFDPDAEACSECGQPVSKKKAVEQESVG